MATPLHLIQLGALLIGLCGHQVFALPPRYRSPALLKSPWINVTSLVPKHNDHTQLPPLSAHQTLKPGTKGVSRLKPTSTASLFSNADQISDRQYSARNGGTFAYQTFSYLRSFINSITGFFNHSIFYDIGTNCHSIGEVYRHQRTSGKIFYDSDNEFHRYL